MNLEENNKNNLANNSLLTIVGQATAVGMAGIGIIRVSGPNALKIAQHIVKRNLQPRYATYGPFYNNNQIIDYGIALYFKAPNSFTGEEVVEFQGHGGQIILQQIIDTVLATNLARLSNPGEFSQQAFFNGKIDIVQAEAIADLIEATSVQVAQAALRSLRGDFSKQINLLLDQLIEIRMFVEASIDFPDEDLEFIGKAKIYDKLNMIHQQIEEVYRSSKQGSVLRDGLKAVIIGEPNAGKSSILNALSQEDVAIVSNIAGTTRDPIKEQVYIDGVPLLIIDTAGLRETNDCVEKIGIERSYHAIQQADFLIFVSENGEFKHQLLDVLPLEVQQLNKIYVSNKFDLHYSDKEPSFVKKDNNYYLDLSVKTGQGLDNLYLSLKELILSKHGNESVMITRKRHLDAFAETQRHLKTALFCLEQGLELELCAEDLRLAQQSLGTITGRYTQDDLLGNIFSNFCIGK